jgi:hypothetical protein
MAAGTSALLIAIGGAAAGIAALSRDDAKPRIVTAVGDAAGAGVGDAAGNAAGNTAGDGAGNAGNTAGDAAGNAAGAGAVGPGLLPGQQLPRGAVAADARTVVGADRSMTRNPAREPVAVGARPPARAQPGSGSGSGSSVAKPSAQPVITTRTEVETREIPYPTRTVSDPGLPRGRQRVQTPGVAGEETLRYLVTLTDGKPTDRRLLDSTVTRQPQQEVVALGAQDARAGRHCPLNFCVPLGRDGGCRHHRRESAQVDDSGQVSVGSNDLALLAGGHGDGRGAGHDGRGGCR